MYGLVSCLPEPFYDKVWSLWRELEHKLGLLGILEMAFFPHFTWFMAEGHDFERACAIVSEIAQGAAPFALRTTGLGLFVNSKAVVYVPVVKTAELARLHALLWERTAEVSAARHAHYAPAVWVPHISLVHEDVQPGQVGRVMEYLAGRAFDWDMVIDNVILVDELAGECVVRLVE
jgi:2'-5' RNA ligase